MADGVYKLRPFCYVKFMISIVVPVYNEEKTVEKLHKRICEVMEKQSEKYEIIFIDDGSRDNTFKNISYLTPLKIISFQRNYGQTAAIDAGIHDAAGDIIIIIDADLQTDPMEIPRFLEKIKEGYDVVVGWRQNRKDGISRVLFSYFANTAVRFVLRVNLHDFGCGFKAYKAKFIKDFRLWGDSQIFLPAVAKEKGAKIYELPISHYAREEGFSKVKISNMFKTSFDLFSLVFFIKYFSKPLRFFGGLGMALMLLSFLAFGSAIVLRLFNVLHFTETPLPVIGVFLAITGVMLFMMGLLAEILLRSYYAITNFSPYVIRETKENK